MIKVALVEYENSKEVNRIEFTFEDEDKYQSFEDRVWRCTSMDRSRQNGSWIESI
jgi:hypothetical protein